MPILGTVPGMKCLIVKAGKVNTSLFDLILLRSAYMSISFMLATIFCSMATGVVTGPLPQSACADTEVSTNIAFNVDHSSMSRINFTVSLDASPTNCVEVSIGTDENDDGRLSVAETDYTFGYDCGQWFSRSAVSDSETFEPDVGTGRREKTFVLKKRALDEAWNLVKVVRRGRGGVCELTTVEGARPGAALIVR